MDQTERPREQQAAEVLNDYVEQLLSGGAPELPAGLDRAELRAYLLAVQIARTRAAAERPPLEVLARLEGRLRRALAEGGSGQQDRPRQGRLNRRQGLAAVAGMAAGVLVGVAVDRV